MQAHTKRRHRSSTPRMTAEQATQFDTMSAQNAAIIKDQIPCECEPYRDVFTFNRWKALGCHVRKGEHGIRIDIYTERTIEDKETGEEKKVKARAKAVCFCRCQVDGNETTIGGD